MTETSDTPPKKPSGKQVPQWLNSAVEFAPLGAFLVTWLTTKDLMKATVVVMIASAIAVAVSFVVQRKIPWMPLVTAVLVGVFGGLTLYLNDESFIKMKPSMVNALFGTVLLGSLAFGKLPIKLLMNQAFEMPDSAWRTLTLRTGVFFFCLAAVNEVVWRTQPTDVWVYFRFPGLMLLTFGYFATQIPYMMKNAKTEEEEA